MVNGHYRPVGYLGDLGCCGCQGSAPATTGSGFDLSSIPTWAWWVAAGVGAFMLLKKK
jgi:hypothetical protein